MSFRLNEDGGGRFCSFSWRINAGIARAREKGTKSGKPIGRARVDPKNPCTLFAGTRGVLNEAVSIYFPDPALAGAFVARWCIGYKVETAEGAFRVREDEPAPRVGAGLHGTP